MKKKIEEEVRGINEKMGRTGEPDTIYATFIERVRENLHIVLCMSPIGEVNNT
jgi:dynein heavy chain